MATSVEQVADAMYEIVKEYKGKKQFTARELTKAMIQKFGDDCDRNMCKQAVRLLMDSKRCVYSYKGSSYVELPPDA
jgi:ubiquitin C-terminal hydrolase